MKKRRGSCRLIAPCETTAQGPRCAGRATPPCSPRNSGNYATVTEIRALLGHESLNTSQGYIQARRHSAGGPGQPDLSDPPQAPAPHRPSLTPASESRSPVLGPSMDRWEPSLCATRRASVVSPQPVLE